MAEKNNEENSGQAAADDSQQPTVKKTGILRKLKTMKKKYFVLWNDGATEPAHLDYHDNEKKFRAGSPSKRSIVLKKCFNINKKLDSKQKHVIALYTKEDCFAIVAENETMLDEWLKALLELQFSGTVTNGRLLKPKFEHVWQVNIGEKSLGGANNLKGPYRLCLTKDSLTLIKMDQSEDPRTIELPLMSFRRCGHSTNYFVLETGRSSVLGVGELWLGTEDVIIARNMHEIVLKAMRASGALDENGPHRPRSSSNSETSRPIATRRPVAIVNAQPPIRDRCDSMPSRPRTISENHGNRNFYMSPSHPLDALRSHGAFGRNVSYSPPGLPNPLSPCSTTCSTDSAGSSLSIDEYDAGQSDFTHGRFTHGMPSDSNILTEPPIKEEQLDDYLVMSSLGSRTQESDAYLPMAPSYSSSAPSGPSFHLNLNRAESAPNNSKSNTLQLSDYVDMTSPVSPPDDYLTMSPGVSNTGTTINSSDSTKYINNNTSMTGEDYLYMAPGTNSTVDNEGYMNMSISSSLPKPTVLSGCVDIFSLTPDTTASNTSISSASDAAKPEEYKLDKVKSLLTQSEDASEDYIRPVRAYSMGSRPQPKKTHLTIHDDGSRIRAYSVGSQMSSIRNKSSATYVDSDIGSLKRADIKTGTKSSSAPLLHNRPPRMRPSASRGNMDEDLMEIDYSRTRFTPNRATINDKDFTIEPVGRNRSGSYSSSVAYNSSDKAEWKTRMAYEREKANLRSSGQSAGNINVMTNSNDYLPMSPLSSVSKSLSKLSTSSQVKVSSEDNHPAGDYVSLDPTVKYDNIRKISTVSSPVTVHNNTVVSYSTSPLIMSSKTLYNKNIPDTNSQNTIKNSTNLSMNMEKSKSTEGNIVKVKPLPQPPNTSEYVCMDYNNVDRNERATAGCAMNRERNKFLNCPGSSSHLIGPPKTPPPSPLMGATPNITNEPFMETLMTQLSKSITQLTPNSRPSSLCDELLLNYAALDLPPFGDDDNTLIMPVHLARAVAKQDTKEVPLTYAQIDFSSVIHPVQETIAETSSHL